MSRRLPVFFLLDISESMAGANLYQMEEAIHTILSNLRKDPSSLESVYISVVVFAGKARTLVPLTELVGFQPAPLPIGGGTDLGAGLAHLMSEIDKGVTRGTAEVKGDWKPLVFLLTDGHPTKDAKAQIDKWNAEYRRRTNLVAVSIGGHADHAVLNQLTDDVVVFMDSAPDAFSKFIKWISVSIQAQGDSVRAGNEEGVVLAKLDDDIVQPLRKFDETRTQQGTLDDNCVVIIGRCEKNKRPYLLKFERNAQDSFYNSSNDLLNLTTTMPLMDSYFELTATGEGASTVFDLTKLNGASACPHCSSPITMALDSNCQNIHCIDGPGKHMCPWCGNVDEYDYFDEGASGIDVKRGQG